MLKYIVPPLALVALVGCNAPEKHDDLGQACLGPVQAFDTGDVVVLEPGDTPEVTVVLSRCASGSVEWSEESCSVTTEGTDITVSSFAKSVTPNAQTDDCNWIALECGTVELEEADYTLNYGQGSTTFSVPYDGGSICAENG